LAEYTLIFEGDLINRFSVLFWKNKCENCVSPVGAVFFRILPMLRGHIFKEKLSAKRSPERGPAVWGNTKERMLLLPRRHF
jgi:hypothetical protein